MPTRQFWTKTSASFDASVLGCGGYGGVVDANGILWSVSPNQRSLLRLDTATMTGGDFNGAVFVTASLVDADLSEGDFTSSDFTSAALNGADLSSADFTNATLDSANTTVSAVRGARVLATGVTADSFVPAPVGSLDAIILE